jgi:hypothetical protein
MPLNYTLRFIGGSSDSIDFILSSWVAIKYIVQSSLTPLVQLGLEDAIWSGMISTEAGGYLFMSDEGSAKSIAEELTSTLKKRGFISDGK